MLLTDVVDIVPPLRQLREPGRAFCADSHIPGHRRRRRKRA
ncbi:hypothetical protein MY3957_007039, partial [Beauveria namnaoensis]